MFEVLRWSEEHAGPRRTHTVSVFAVGRSLIRLAGTDPTAPESWADWPDPPAASWRSP